jgi:hypothetical protein
VQRAPSILFGFLRGFTHARSTFFGVQTGEGQSLADYNIAVRLSVEVMCFSPSSQAMVLSELPLEWLETSGLHTESFVEPIDSSTCASSSPGHNQTRQDN